MRREGKDSPGKRKVRLSKGGKTVFIIFTSWGHVLA